MAVDHSHAMTLKGKHVFIVEDNIENRVVFQMILIKHGAFVEFERWGRDAIRRIKDSFKIDLIILDLMLKQGVSGFDIYDEIRAMPEFADIPIIAVSAMDPSVAMPKARAKGFNGFIAKPVDSHLFPVQIARILEGEQVWHAGEQMLR